MSNKSSQTPSPPTAQPPVAVRAFTDARGCQWVEVEYKSKSALLEYRAFASDRGAIWSTLASRGPTIVSKAVKASVIQQVEDLEAFPHRLIFDRPGWHQGQFVNASGKVFAPACAEKGAVAFTPNTVKCGRKGNAASWTREVAQHLVGHPIPSFFLMLCFAAPMLDLAGRQENIGAELAGEGGKGKSTTQRLMASTVGPAMEKDRGYITSFFMTPAALEQSMRWHSDMPFIIDEANLFGSGDGGRANNQKMQDFSFQMSGGFTKGRFDSAQQEGFRFIYVTSANEPFCELLSRAHRDVANAATDRLMTITIPEGDAGVFGSLPSGYDSYRQFTLMLEEAMSRQYGTAMPKFLKALVSQRDKDDAKLKARIRQHIDTFKREVGVNENNGSDVRVAEAFGLAYAAGEFARHFRILPADFDCLGAAVHCYVNFRSTVPVRQPLPERLLAIASRPETMRIDRRALPELTDEQVEAAGAFIRMVKGETLLLMTPTFGNRMLPDWNSLKRTADFADLNKANERGRGRGYHCRIRSNGSASWFYAFLMPATASPGG